MTVTAFLRRASASPARNEYFFLTAETMEPLLDRSVITPRIPGGDPTKLFGPTSPNFQLDIGSEQLTIRVSGFIVPLASADVATLPSAGVDAYVTGTDSSGNTTLATSFPSSVTGKALRSALYSWASEQSNAGGNWSNFRFGWPDWGNSDLTIAGQEYRLFEGLIRQVRTVEVASEPDQYLFLIDLVVGDN